MWKFSMTRPGADSEIVDEQDDGGLWLEDPERFMGRAPFGRFPQKLNTFTYLTVNFACIFAH